MLPAAAGGAGGRGVHCHPFCQAPALWGLLLLLVRLALPLLLVAMVLQQ